MSYVGASNAAMGINDSGVIVGESCINTSQSAYHAFIYGYQGNNTMQDMNTVFASMIPANISYLACATAIDNNGDITGVAVTTAGTTKGSCSRPRQPRPNPRPCCWLLPAWSAFWPTPGGSKSDARPSVVAVYGRRSVVRAGR